MKYTLALQKLPFEPERKQIIFIEGKHDEKVVDLVRWNFRRIRERFESRGYDFCYIPYLKQDLVSGERLHYNAPFAKSSREAEFMVNDNFILDYMLHPENRENIPPSLLFYIPDFRDKQYPEAEVLFQGVPITESSFEGDEGLGKVLDEIREEIRKENGKHTSDIRFSIEPDRKRNVSAEFELRRKPIKGDLLEMRMDVSEAYNRAFDPEEMLDEEAARWWHQIEENIEKLRQKGIESAIIESLFKNHKRRLSRLRITKDFRIYLPEYFGMEIHMTPLPKALYFLYLRHPEGIMFSFLPDFREELMEIYKAIKGPLFNLRSAQKSIEDVTNPIGNSINEKVSRIREAFIEHFDEHLARNYFITGARGEAKKITLPRELVVWEE